MCASAIAWFGLGRVIWASNYTYLAKQGWQPFAPTLPDILADFSDSVNPYANLTYLASNVLSNITDPMFIKV